MNKGIPIDIAEGIAGLEFLPDRTPETYGSGPETFARRLADYRNGGVFVSHWAGLGEWERHPNGDEVVLIVEGEADVFLVQDGHERQHHLRTGQLIVVPENTWHRLRTDGAKVITVTPRPTEHQVEFPK